MSREFLDDSIHESKAVLDNWQKYWDSIQPEVVRDLQTMVGLAGVVEPQRQPDRFRRFEGALLHEKEFVRLVATRLKNALDTKPRDTACLFDIYDTIAITRPEGRSYQTILRPSLFPLFDLFESLSVRIGVIPSLEEKALQAALEDPQQLQAIRDYLDPSLILTSARYRGKKDPIDAALVKNREAMQYLAESAVAAAKLRLLADIKVQHSDTTLVVVDDLDYPRYLNENAGMFGVSLPYEARFFVP